MEALTVSFAFIVSWFGVALLIDQIPPRYDGPIWPPKRDAIAVASTAFAVNVLLWLSGWAFFTLAAR